VCPVEGLPNDPGRSRGRFLPNSGSVEGEQVTALDLAMQNVEV